MNWKLKIETRDEETGCRSETKVRPDGMFAGIYGYNGIGVVSLERLGRRDNRGVVMVHDQVSDNETPEAHATTDEEWHSITRCIDAAPEMLAVLEGILEQLNCKRPIMAIDLDIIKRNVRDVLAKAKKPMPKVKPVSKKVTMEVEARLVVDTVDGCPPMNENVAKAAVAALLAGKVEITNMAID